MWSSLPSQASFESKRRTWLTQAHEGVRRSYSELRISSHSLLLLIDIERAFCGGAWLSTIVMAQASVEATYRQILEKDYASTAAQLFGKDPDLSWLRELRNEIIHAQEPGTLSKLWKLSASDLPGCQDALEDEARKAIILAYRAIYAAADA
jgi:hypothetical protein